MTAPTYEIRPPSEVLAEDVICQSFVQSSSTLAYACLALRRGRHDLAAHVLHSLAQKPASRFKDMVFYLQAQIAIETGDFADVKKRLAARAQQHPGDMVALSLLASAVFLEWEDWLRRNPSEAVRAPAAERTVEEAPDMPDSPAEAEAGMPAYHTIPVPTVPSPHAAFSDQAPGSDASPPPAGSGIFRSDEAPATAGPGRSPAPPRAPAAPARPPAGAEPDDKPFTPAAGGDFGVFQALVADPNTQALALWNLGTRKVKTACKKPALEGLVEALPEALPAGLAGPIRSLEGGEILKVCFSFRALTVTSLHTGAENLGLVTGNMSQSLLTMVRAENLFLKAVPGAAGFQGGANPARAGSAS